MKKSEKFLKPMINSVTNTSKKFFVTKKSDYLSKRSNIQYSDQLLTIITFENADVTLNNSNLTFN